MGLGVTADTIIQEMLYQIDYRQLTPQEALSKAVREISSDFEDELDEATDQLEKLLAQDPGLISRHSVGL